MEGSYTIATINCFTHIGMDTCFSIYRVIPEIRVTGFYEIGCTNDRLNIEGVGSSDHVITTSLNYQCHGVGSSVARNNGIERSLSPIDRIYVCNRLAIFTCIIHLDCFDSSIHLRQCTLCQYRSHGDACQRRVCHHLRCYNRSNLIGVHNILAH